MRLYFLLVSKWKRTPTGNGIGFATRLSKHFSRDAAIGYAENHMADLDAGRCVVIDEDGNVHLSWTRPGNGQIFDPPKPATEVQDITVSATGEWGLFLDRDYTWRQLEGLEAVK